MKKSVAVVATTALAGLSTLALAASATASTPIGDAVFYTTADFGVETGAGYPANDWFHGELGSSWTQAAVSSSATGLNVVAGAGQASQILNNESFLITDVGDFTSDIGGIDVRASSDAWVFQIPVFGETDSEFTTLRPADPGTTDPNGAWITSGAITDGAGGTTYGAGASDTLGNLVNALQQGAATEVLAYGFWVGPDSSVSFYAVDAFDDLSVFTPIPTRSVTPNPVTPEQTTTTGLVFSGSGWFPGEEIYIMVFECEGDSISDSYEGDSIAAADGTFSVTVIFDEPLPIGTYCYDFDDDDVLYNAEVLPTLENLVVSAAVIEDEDVTAPALADTGTESLPYLYAAVLAVILGAGALVASIRTNRRFES